MGRLTRGQLYDRLIAEADTILERDNPCNIECGVGCTCGTVKAGTAFCCHGCEHLSPAGCTVDALACKVWLCFTAQEKYPQTVAALWEVSQRATAAGIPMIFRGSKEQHLDRSYRNYPRG